MLDVGLLACHASVPVQALVYGDEAFEELKGALTEQFVAQELALMPRWKHITGQQNGPKPKSISSFNGVRTFPP